MARGSRAASRRPHPRSGFHVYELSDVGQIAFLALSLSLPSVKGRWDTSQTSQSLHTLGRPLLGTAQWGACLRSRRRGRKGVGQGQDGSRAVLLCALDDVGLFNFCLELDMKVNFVCARLRICCIFALLNIQQQVQTVRSLPGAWSFGNVS